MDRIDERLNGIESRLATLEEAISGLILDLEQTPAPVTQAPAQPVPPPQNPQVPLPPQEGWSGQYRMQGDEAHAPASMSNRATRSKMDVNWLGIVAVICFVLAAGFIVKLAVESGWLTPERQIGLSILFGVSLIGAGFWLRKSDRNYASLLPGAGVVVLYLSFLAATTIHHLVPVTTGLVLVSFVSALCIWIYDRLDLKIYLITAIVGSYLAPTVLGVEVDFSIGYFLLCSLAFASLSIWFEERLATIVAAYFAILFTAIGGFSLKNDVFVANALSLQFVIFVGGTVIHSAWKRKILTREEAWAFFPVLMLFYASEYFYIHRIAPTYAPWISIAFAAFLIGVYEGTKRTMKDAALRTGDVIIAYATVVLFHSVYLELLNDQIRPWLLPVIALAAAFAPVTATLKQKRDMGWIIPLVAIAIIAVVEYVRIASSLITIAVMDKPWIACGFASVAAILAVYIRKPFDTKGRDEVGFAILAAAHGLAILALYRLLEDYGSLAVSGGWLTYAVVTMGRGFQARDAIFAKSALMVLALAAAKALLYDAASAPTIVRILCLLVTGVVLYACGFLLRRISTWSK